MKSCLKRFRHSGLEKCGTVQKLHPSFIFFHPEYTVAFTSAPENARGINEINILVPLEKMLHFLLKIKKLVGTGHSISMGQSKKILKGTIHFTKCFQNHTLISRARSAACDPHLRMLPVGLLTKLT